MERDFRNGSRIAILPAMYLWYYFNKLDGRQQADFPIFNTLLSLPVVYGTVFALLNQFQWHDDPQFRYAWIGAVAGEIYSLMGRNVLNIPERVFNMSDPASVHWKAPLGYALVYYLAANFSLL